MIRYLKSVGEIRLIRKINKKKIENNSNVILIKSICENKLKAFEIITENIKSFKE